MISSWPSARTQVGHEVVVFFDTDIGGDVTWSVHSTSDVDWVSFPDDSIGTARGAPAGGDETALLIVTCTNGTDVDVDSMVMNVVPPGLQLVYDPVRQPAGSPVVAVPEVWSAFGNTYFRPVQLPAGFTLDPRTGVLAGPMPDTAVEARVMLIDEADDVVVAPLALTPVAQPGLSPTVEATYVGPDGRPVLVFAAGETVDVPVTALGATPPLTAALVGAPAWTTVSDGDEVRIGGVTTPGGRGRGGDGLIDLTVADAAGLEGRLRVWAEVGAEIPLRLIVPPRIAGDAMASWPEVYARVVGGTAPIVLAVEQGTGSISSATRRITGTFAATPGVVPHRYRATDAGGQIVFATMQVETLPGEFAITLADIEGQASTAVDVTPTVTSGYDVRWWAKESGPAFLSVDEDTGQVTGTLPSTAGAFDLVLFAQAETGEQARLTVPVTVTLGAVSCSIPAVAAVRGAPPAFVQIAVSNAPGGWTTVAETGSNPLFRVTETGFVTWQDLTSEDTDVTPIVVRVNRVGGGTATCSVTPTISDPPAVLTCTFEGPDFVAPGASAEYRFTDPADAVFSLTSSDADWTVSGLGGGRYRVTAPSDSLGKTTTLTATAVVGGVTSASCGKVVEGGWPPPVRADVQIDLDANELSSSWASASRTRVNRRLVATSTHPTPNFEFSVPSDANLGGLTLGSSGEISGRATATAGTYSADATVRETNSNQSTTFTLTVVVSAAALSCDAEDTTFRRREVSSAPLVAAKGGTTGEFSYSATGVTINASTGVVTGLDALAEGETNYTVNVSDGSATASCSGTITVRPRLSCAATPSTGWLQPGQSRSFQLPAPTGISGTPTYVLASGPTVDPARIPGRGTAPTIRVTSSGMVTVAAASDAATSSTVSSREAIYSWAYAVSVVAPDGETLRCTGRSALLGVRKPPLSCAGPSRSGTSSSISRFFSVNVTGLQSRRGYDYVIQASGSGFSFSRPGGTSVSGRFNGVAPGTYTYTVTVTERLFGTPVGTGGCTGTFTIS